MTEASRLTAGHYGFCARRIHRDDFAKVIASLVPGDGLEWAVTQVEVSPEDIAAAARICHHLGVRYTTEPLGWLAERVSFRLEHPMTRNGPGELLFYAAALLCREQEAVAAVEAATSVEAVLENRAARRAADALEPVADAALRYAIQTSFDGDFVRAAPRHPLLA